MADARSKKAIESNRQADFKKLHSQALKKVKAWSSRKKAAALKTRDTLRKKYPEVKKDT